MNKVAGVKWIVRGYFAAALIFSFSHLIDAARKAGGEGAEAIATPFIIDGFFVIGAVMRGNDFSARTRRIGLWVQTVSGLISSAGNMYAAHSLFGYAFGAALPLMVVFTEWLSDARQMKSADAEAAELATAEAARIVAEAEAATAAKKAASVAKAQATRARNARTRKAQTKALESMLNA